MKTMIEERSIPEPTTGCWLWEGAISKNGYGSLRHPTKGKTTYAHRFSFFVHNGYLPVVVRHRCDQRACVNPDHLVGGTQAENLNDMMTRGRRVYVGRKGESAGNVILTDALVTEIRSLAGYRNATALGRRFGVHHSTVSKILKRKMWKHI